jgi:hypothetical protein
VIGGEALGEGVYVVDDGVELADEGVDIFAIEGGDERAVEAVEGLVGELIGFVFFLTDAGDLLVVGEIEGELVQMSGTRDGMRGQTFKEVVKDRVLREQIEHY